MLKLLFLQTRVRNTHRIGVLSEYAEVDIKTPPPVLSSRVPDYEYADVNAMNKWALQHIARGVNQDTPAIGGVDGAYSVVDVQAGVTWYW